MKTTINGLKELLGTQFQKFLEDIDRERRSKAGYDLEDEGAGQGYGDLPENVEIVEETPPYEDLDRLRRHADGYGDDMEEECGEEPMALRVRLHPKPDNDDPLMSPPVGMTDMGDESDMGEMYGEATPPGFEDVVMALKKEPDVENPWAVAQSMKKKGIEPKKESVMPSLKSVLLPPKKKSK